MARTRGPALRVRRGPGAHRRLTSVFAVIAVLLSMATATIALPGAAAAAAAIPFDTFFSTQDNGAIALLGNSQMTCPSSSTGCASAQSAVATTNAQSNVDNNGFAMTFVDADSDSTTSNSTSADLSLPAGSTVLSALLVWGGRRADSITLARAAQVKFKAPGAVGYSQ